MESQTNSIIQFPTKQKTKTKQHRFQKGFKYFNEDQIKLIRRTVREQAQLAIINKKISPIREWAVLDLLTSTGIRVSEAANLRISDIQTQYSKCSIYIRDGKGGYPRTIQIPANLRKHLKQFLRWKKEMQEPLNDNDFVFIGQRGAWKACAIQQIVKKYLRQLNLYENGKSVHALRHSYAVQLYRQSKDIRAVQKQLGHASIQTTQIYADVLDEDIQDQIKNLWN